MVLLTLCKRAPYLTVLLAAACGTDVHDVKRTSDTGPSVVESDGGAGGTTSTGGSDHAPSTGGDGDGSTALGSDAAVDPLAPCKLPPACDATPMDPGPKRPFRHNAPFAGPNHRGRDLFVVPSDPQWVLAKFAYGATLLEAGLQDEEVDVYLLRDCGSKWEKLGTALTTAQPKHATVEGVADEAGRVFFEIPADKKLGLGRHRVRLVVAGDLSATEQFIEVVAPSTPFFVSDVDGTLTTAETEQFTALLTGAMTNANMDAALALTHLAAKGYRPMYLTARPEWLVQVTRDFIAKQGFPPGIIHTTLGGTGATGTAATTFKTDELALLADKMLKPAYAIGNTNTDADAYENGAIAPVDHRLFYKYDDTAHGGRRIDAYGTLVPEFDALPNACH